MSHQLVIDDGTLRLVCTSPATAACRTRHTCDCEAFTDTITDAATAIEGTIGGKPVHVVDGIFHWGEFDPTYCCIVEWFESCDPEDLIHGTVTIPVRVDWDESPVLHIGEPAPSAAPDTEPQLVITATPEHADDVATRYAALMATVTGTHGTEPEQAELIPTMRIRCDGCHQWAPDTAITTRQAVHAAIRRGWWHAADSTDWCPDCTPPEGTA